ncbi:MAG: hypothetical protein QG639_837 [Patescibacteria group bacterium]|nr:hypothetical protein [Patescibacteria group bacterium]
MNPKRITKQKNFKKKIKLNHSVILLPLLLIVCLFTTFTLVQGQFGQFVSSLLVNAQDSKQQATYKASQFVSQEDGKPSTSAWFGGATSSQSYAGILFENISLPKDAVITDLELKMVPVSDQWISQKTEIYVEKNAKPAKFSKDSLPSSRPLSSQFVSYADNTKWEKDKQYTLPNLKSLVPALQTSESMNIAIIIKGVGGQYGRKFVYGTGDKAPELIIKYQVPGSSTTPTPTPSNSGTPSSSPTSSPAPTTSPGDDHGGQVGTNSHAMGMWTPSKWDTCTKEFHDSYYVIGQDGKKYPTWHPPMAVNPATGKECTFGHEHGRDPYQSDLYGFIQEQNAYDANQNGKIESDEKAKSGIAFGFVNEQLDVYNSSKGITNGMRHEDHVGYKIMWENNVQRDESVTSGGSNRRKVDLYCDMFMMQHQGTHSVDAFTNNVHATGYYIDCNQGSLVSQYPAKLALNFMSIFGKAGGFSEGGFAGGFDFIQVGTPNPANSPSAREPGRSLPTINRVNQHVLVANGQFSRFSEGLYEDWISGSYLRSAQGKVLAYVDPHFAVFGPSRFYDPSKPNNIGRSIDVCYMKESNGDRARGGECDEVTNYKDGSTIPVSERITYDDPRSPFNGCKREFYFNNNGIFNQGGPTAWYTDPYGQNGSTKPFAGSIRQYIASAETKLPYPLESIALGANINWCGRGVHAPN